MADKYLEDAVTVWKDRVTKDSDSDSDEVPSVLLDLAPMTPSSEEADSDEKDVGTSCATKKCLFGLNKKKTISRTQEICKRKLQGELSSDSDSDFYTGINGLRRMSTDSSSAEPDLQSKMASVTKLTQSRKAKRKRKRQDLSSISDVSDSHTGVKRLRTKRTDSSSNTDKLALRAVVCLTRLEQSIESKLEGGSVVIQQDKDRARSSSVRKVPRTLRPAEHTSTSSSEEEAESDSDSGDDDVQRIRDITEDRCLLGAMGFHQSSGEDEQGPSGPSWAAGNDEDDAENRIAKNMLMAQIKAGSSGSDFTSEEEFSQTEQSEPFASDSTDKNDTRRGGKKTASKTSSGSDSEVNEAGYRHPLLRHKLTLDDRTAGANMTEEDGEEDEKKDEKKERKHAKKRAKQENTQRGEDDSQLEHEDSGLTEELSHSDNDGNEERKKSSKSSSSIVDPGRSYLRKKQKPLCIVLSDSSTDEDTNKNENKEGECKLTPKGRRKIRKILDDENLCMETQEAVKEEEDRRKRLTAREQRREELRDVIVIEDEESHVACRVTTKLVLDQDKKTKEPLIQIHRNLVTQLKPHQVDGVQFIWDCCCETVKLAQTTVGSGCILAHCMGLGKTLQVITFLHTVLLSKILNFRTALVVCPLNTILNWVAEFNKWQATLGNDKVKVYELTTKRPYERHEALQRWNKNGGVMIMGYEMYRNLTLGYKITNQALKKNIRSTLVNPGPDFLICDEGHILRNESSNINKALSAIKTRRRVVLTGTPMQNNLEEYHCMVNFIKENLLGSLKEFRNRFINPIQNGQCADSTPGDVRIMKNRSHVLHAMMAGCVQRRDYTDLAKFLPSKHEYVLAVRVTPLQCTLYRYYLKNFTRTASLVDGVQVRAGPSTSLFKDFQVLGSIWTHPWCLQLRHISKENKGHFNGTNQTGTKPLFGSGESIGTSSMQKENREVVIIIEDDDEMGDKWPNPAVEAAKAAANGRSDSPSANWFKDLVSGTANVLEHSGKMVILFEILRMAEELKDKVLVFSQSLISLDLIEDFLELAHKAKVKGDSSIYKGTSSWVKNKDYYRLDGSTSATLRKKWAEDFNNATNTRGRLFLISTRAGSLGINLVAANRVIIFDASWNPSYDIQSIFRVYRFGQIKKVFVYRLLAQGTMEEKIYDRQVAKQSLSFRVVDQQQIKRHFTLVELTELYSFEPDLLNSKKTTHLLPKDVILAELLQSCKEQIVRYHEHESLLDHKEEEALSIADRRAAWAEYEAEGRTIILNRQSANAAIAGPSVAGPSVAGPSVAGPSFGGSSVAGCSAAGPFVAGRSVAGSSIAGRSVAGPSVAGPSNYARSLYNKTNNELKHMIEMARRRVSESIAAMQSIDKTPLEDYILQLWAENPELTAEQVEARAQQWKASSEAQLRTKNATYKLLLAEQLNLTEIVKRILKSRNVKTT